MWRQAVRSALPQRTDLQIARNNFESNNVLFKSQRNSALPDVDAIVTYGASGLGGTQYEFSGSGLDRVRQGIAVHGGYNDALSTLFNRDYPNWQFALQRELSRSAATTSRPRPPARAC